VKKEYVGTEVFTKLIVGTDLDAKATPNTAFVFTKCDRCVGLVAPLACLGKDGPAPAMDPDATMYAPLRGSNCDLAALPVAATEFKDGLPSAMPGTFRMYDRKQFACDGLSLQKTVRLENVFGTNITRLSQLARSPDAQGEAQDTVLTFQTNGTSRMEIPCSNPVATAPTAVRWAPSSNNGKPGFVLMYDGKVQEFYEDVGSVGRVGNATCPATCTQPSDCALCGGGSTCSRGACTTASTGTLSTPSTGTLSTTP
jgi:hypothetical protein